MEKITKLKLNNFRPQMIEQLATTTFIILWDFLVLKQIFLSPQGKRCAIITYKNGIYEFRHNLMNNLRLAILGSFISTACSPHEKIEKQNVNFSRSAMFHMETRVSLKYFVNGCLWKPFFTYKLPQTSPNLISLTILVTLRLLAQF